MKRQGEGEHGGGSKSEATATETFQRRDADQVAHHDAGYD